MPVPVDPAMIGAAVSGGTQLVSNIANIASTVGNNRAARKYATKMYNRQRQDALDDYARQNEYNTPEAQMARYKKAGLNPNLIYGQTNEGGIVRSTDAKSWTPDAPEIRLDAGPIISQYYDTQIKKQTYDNLKAQNDVIVQDALQKQASTAYTSVLTSKTASDAARSSFDLHLAEDLRATSLEAAKASVEKTHADTTATLSENDRRQALQSSSLAQAAANILNTRAQTAKSQEERDEIRARIRILQSDDQLKKLDLNLKRLGIQPGDNMFLRMLGQYLGKGGLDTFNKIF